MAKITAINAFCVLLSFVIGVTSEDFKLQFWTRETPKFESRRHDGDNITKTTNKSDDGVNNSTPMFEFRHRIIGDKFRRGYKTTKRKNKNDLWNFKKAKLRSTKVIPMQQDAEPELEKTTKPMVDSSGRIDKDMYDLNVYNIVQDLADLEDKFSNSANITIEVLGRTAEFKDIALMKISKKDGTRVFRAEDKYVDETPPKRIIFIVHGLSVNGLKNVKCLRRKKEFSQLLSYYLEHLDLFDIFLIPVANPDGFRKSVESLSSLHGVDMEFWNKNLSPQSGCPGVALDRNFEVAWNASQATGSSCSPQYSGPVPFSEVEARAIRDIFHLYSYKIAAYIHVHPSSISPSVKKGDAVLFPKGYAETNSDDDKYIDLRGEIEEAVKNASFQVTSVIVDTLHSWYGPVYGTSVDYASTVYGIPYAFEFLMQPFLCTHEETDAHCSLQVTAMEELWRRVIRVVFQSIYRNVHGEDHRRLRIK